MPTKPLVALSATAIEQINSLGGPPLPTGISAPALNILMENMAAAQAPPSLCRVAASFAARRL